MATCKRRINSSNEALLLQLSHSWGDKLEVVRKLVKLENVGVGEHSGEEDCVDLEGDNDWDDMELNSEKGNDPINIQNVVTEKSDGRGENELNEELLPLGAKLGVSHITEGRSLAKF